jgi:hypothetical protein
LSHGHADVGALEGWGVVHTVAGGRHHLAHRPQGGHDPQLVLGGGAGEQNLPSDSWLRSSSSGMASSCPPSMTATSGLIDDADLAGDRLGGEPVVAGDHHDPDAGRPAPLDGGHHLLTGRVQRGGQAGEDQLLLDRPRADGVDLGLEVGGQVVVGMPRTRSPARAMRSFSSITWSRSAWVRGTSRPFTSAWV